MLDLEYDRENAYSVISGIEENKTNIFESTRNRQIVHIDQSLNSLRSIDWIYLYVVNTHAIFKMLL